MSSNLFISHASKDKELVDDFVDLIQLGVGVPREDIFYTSRKGQGVKPGEFFVDRIGASLKDSTIVVALISANFYNSAFCMCELGAVWIKATNFVPVLVPPISYSDLKAILTGIHASNIGIVDDLDEIRDILIDQLGVKKSSTPEWYKRRKVFLAKLPGLLTRIGKPEKVTRAELEAVEKERDEYVSAYEEKATKLEGCNAVVAQLRELKDTEEVAKVLAQHSDRGETFELLTSVASGQVGRLAKPVQEALYQHFRGGDYRPNGYDADLCEDYVEEGMLELNEEQGAFELRLSNPAVAAAVKRLDELVDWLDGDEDGAGVAFHKEYLDRYGEEADIRLRPFWREHFRVF